MRKCLLIKACAICPFYIIHSQEDEEITYKNRCQFYDRIMTNDDIEIITGNDKPDWCKMNELEANDHSSPKEREGSCGICKKMKKDLHHLPVYVWGSEGIWVCLDCRKIMGELMRALRGFVQDANKQAFLNARKKEKE